MNIFIFLDDKNGMMFNKRRQSQDTILREHIKNLVNNKTLYMNEYSYKLYKDIDNNNIKVSNDFLDKGTSDDFYLVENLPLINYTNKINSLIIFKWNRHYPSDLYFDINLLDNSWELIETIDFKGSSHEKITKEIYRRVHNEK